MADRFGPWWTNHRHEQGIRAVNDHFLIMLFLSLLVVLTDWNNGISVWKVNWMNDLRNPALKSSLFETNRYFSL